ncbi:hypothetical protein H5410_026975 [Solanum commersonii]|uniref:Uncharacterized protein n=1 Tax=Solanum commersonii TaxID=4109 RepID=A0A9J5YXQ0_SOLCO|nr:hypothetical protein H5410_026975 [Solanum commersonii]
MRGNNPRGRGRSSSGSSYGSSSNSPILQRGGMSLINLNSKNSQSTASSSVHLEDTPENNPLYTQLQEYLSQKQSDTFASIAKEEIDDSKSFEKEYGISPQKGIVADNSVRYIARKISVQDGDKEAMINNYLEEVKRSLLLNITQYEKSDIEVRPAKAL